MITDLEIISRRLASGTFNPGVFEECTCDLLSTIYPGLVPITGGSDSGRDADIHIPGEATPARLCATASTTLDGIRANMVRGIRSMQEHSVPCTRVVLANLGRLTQTNRKGLAETAATFGVQLDSADILDAGYFASRLRCDGHWRQELLGMSSEPLGLSSAPQDLAESQWSALPLVGRKREIAAIAAGSTDVILCGPPGVGKSRMAYEIDGAVFAEKDAGFDQVASSLRIDPPLIVIVDDAGAHAGLVRRLLHLRQQERDLLEFRLVVICWPHEVEVLSSDLPHAETVEVGLMERSEIDTILLSMGISGELARAEILDQAEGRPGWAIALGDLLLRARADSLADGTALLGEVTRYLLRAGLPESTLDCLALVAALGWIDNEELDMAADVLGTDRLAVRNALVSAAHGGLVEVAERAGRDSQATTKSYGVRPPMLGRALVASRAYDAMLPPFDLDTLDQRWPSRDEQLARAAIECAHLGASGAREEAEVRLTSLIAERGLAQAHDLAKMFAALDEPAGQLILNLADPAICAELARPDFSAPRLDPLVGLTAFIARRYKSPRAVTLVLDAALRDDRPTNQYPDHPLRQIERLITDFHPEIPYASDLRDLVCRCAMEWVADDPDDEVRWAVVANVVSPLLSFELSGAHSDPGDWRKLNLRSATLSSAEMTRVFSDIWPNLVNLLEKGHDGLAVALVRAVDSWLLFAGGFGGANTAPEEARLTARRLGEEALGHLAGMPLSPGLTAYLRRVSAIHDVELDLALPEQLGYFFDEVDRGADLDGEAARVVREIREKVPDMRTYSAKQAVATLLDIRSQLELAAIRWPDRVQLACNVLSEIVEDPETWLRACVAQGLVPEGVAFLQPLVARDAVPNDLLYLLLGTPRARWASLTLLLANYERCPTIRDEVIRAVEPGDYGLLDSLFLRNEFPSSVTRVLLTATDGPTRGAVAAAMHGGLKRGDEWKPGELGDEWADAIKELRPADTPGLDNWDIGNLFSFMAKRYPTQLTGLVGGTLEQVAGAGVYDALGHAGWDSLYLLPVENKLELWNHFKGRVDLEYRLRGSLVGADPDFLEVMLDSGEIEPDEVLGLNFGFEPQIRIEHLAKTLVPRGVSPGAIAASVQYGTVRPSGSPGLREIVSEFEVLQSSEDEYVAAVGSAGIELFSPRIARAEAEEKERRIKGGF